MNERIVVCKNCGHSIAYSFSEGTCYHMGAYQNHAGKYLTILCQSYNECKCDRPEAKDMFGLKGEKK